MNKGQLSWSHCVARDESFLIFAAERPDSVGGIDLYVSFNVDGSWTPARNLGSGVNTGKSEVWPRLSPEGKYLFFNREGGEEGILQIEVGPLLESLHPQRG